MEKCDAIGSTRWFRVDLSTIVQSSVDTLASSSTLAIVMINKHYEAR